MKITFLIIVFYILYELSFGFLICNYKYKIKRYKVLIKVAKKSPEFIFPFTIGTGTGALLVMLTATSWLIIFLDVIVAIISLKSALKAHFKIKLKNTFNLSKIQH